MLYRIKEKYRNAPVQAKASLWFLICSFLQKGISTVTTPIFTRLLNSGEYGHYNVFISWMDIVGIIVTLYLSSGVYGQGLVKFEEDRKVFSSSLQGLTATLVTMWTIVYLLFRNFWNSVFSLTTVQILAMLLMVWTSAVFSFWSAEQRVSFKYRNLVIISLAVSLAKPLLSILFILYANDKVTARILGLAFAELFGYSWLFIVQQYRGKKFFSKRYWTYAIKFNIPLVPHYLSQTVLNSSDRIMIGRMVGMDKTGIYALAYSVSMIMILFNSALMQTLNPWIYQKIKSKRIKDISPIAYSTLILIAALNILVIILAPEIISIFAPPSYYEAIYVVPPVAMSVYFMYCYNLFAGFSFYFEKTKFVMLASMIGAALNLVLNYIFINLFGYIAAGYTTLVCYVVYSVCHYMFMNKVCKENCDGERPYKTAILLKIGIPFLCCGIVLTLTYRNSWVRYGVLLAFIAICVYKRQLIVETVSKIMGNRK